MWLFFCTAYLFATVEEWLFHKFMHLGNTNSIQRNHMIHHLQSSNVIKPTHNYAENICFDFKNWNELSQVILFGFGNSVLLSAIFPTVSIYTVILTNSGLLAYNILAWNTYHSFIHGFDAFTLCGLKGIPRKYVPTQNIYSKWVIENHQTHHMYPTGNFNIVFPGADFIFMTYRT